MLLAGVVASGVAATVAVVAPVPAAVVMLMLLLVVLLAGDVSEAVVGEVAAARLVGLTALRRQVDVSPSTWLYPLPHAQVTVPPMLLQMDTQPVMSRTSKRYV